MTLPDGLYAYPAAIHRSSLRATARNAGLRFNFDGGTHNTHSTAGNPNRFPSGYGARCTRDHRSPSSRNPAGHVDLLNSHSHITASVTPATYSKRPYRNRPG